MSKKLLIIILASVIGVASIVTPIAVVLSKKNNQGAGNSGDGTSISSPIDSTSGPSSSSDPTTVEEADRSKYSLFKIVLGYAQIPTYDFIVGVGDPESDYSKAVDKIFEGYTIGDIYTQVIDLAVDMLEESEQIGSLGVDINALIGDLNYYYGTDGNWYTRSSNKKTNELLNQVLSYKIDGTGQLNLDLAVYGNKTVAYIFFDYTGESSGTMDIDAIIGMLMQASPIMDSLLNVTLNQLVTLIDGTSSERIQVLHDVFADLRIKDILDLTGIDISQNKLLSATATVTFNQILELSTGDVETLKTFISTTYQGLTIADSIGINPSHPAYIAALHGLSFSEFVVSAINGEVKQFILTQAGDLKLKRLFNSFAALAGWENDYTTYLQENKEFFDYTLEDFDALLSQFDLEKYVIRGVNNSVIGFDIELLTTDYEEELALLKGAYEGFTQINSQKIDQVLVEITGKTLDELEVKLDFYVDLYTRTQSVVKAAGALIDDIYDSNKEFIDKALAAVDQTYESIKTKIQPYVEAAIEFYKNSGDFRATIDDLIDNILGELGLNVDMTVKDIFEYVVLAELVDMIPEGELVNFESILGDTLVITKEDVYYLYEYKFGLVPNPDAFDALLKDLFGEFKIGSLLDFALSYLPTDSQPKSIPAA